MATTLAVLSVTTQQVVTKLVGELNSLKSDKIGDIVALFKSDSVVTPEHLLAGIKKQSMIGWVYAGWYVSQSGIAISAVETQTGFFTDNYNSIVVQKNEPAMAAEIARVREEVRLAKEALERSNRDNGTSTRQLLSDLQNAATAVMNSEYIGSDEATSSLDTIQSILNQIKVKNAHATTVGELLNA